MESKNPPALTSEITPPIAPIDPNSSNGDLVNYTVGLEKALYECNRKLSKLQ